MPLSHRLLALLLALAALPACAAPNSLRLSAPASTEGAVTGESLGPLATGGRQQFHLHLDHPQSLDLRVHFASAPFSGAQLNVLVNTTRLLPYFAFGGDTRYDNVHDQPRLHPPLATLEGRWLVPPALLHAGDNTLELWTVTAPPSPVLEKIGPAPVTRIDALTLRPADGRDLPLYANPIYYDFAVWSQGFDWGNDPTRHYNYDMALLGVINGKGMPDVIPPIPHNDAGLWATKRSAESNYLDWGYRNQEYYTIWQFSAHPEAWAKPVDADHNPKTQTRFHSQTVDEGVQDHDPFLKGADVLYYDVPTWAASLEPSIRELGPYMTYYMFKCEQHGPWGAGFGNDGEAWAKYGIHRQDWAGNYYQAYKAARDLVQKYNPDGRVEEGNHWIPSIRYALFDTALARKEPMGNMIDAITTHFSNLFSYDLDAQGHMIPGEILDREYPGGQFEKPDGFFFKHLIKEGYLPHQDTLFPEIAIDFNRYRLGRSQSDLLPQWRGDANADHKVGPKVGPKVGHWSNGQPFDYRAGCRGDELMYNSENGIWFGYSAPSPYQYLHGFFTYSLLPSGASEPSNLDITIRKSLLETQQKHVNVYGQWVNGIAHTKRLRTADPLYGDMFGWTGDEHCNAGDYISMVGIMDPHHRRQPFDAYSLVRRTCYGFVTTGTVVPSYANPGHDDALMVKTLYETFEGRPYFGIYAANFDDKPHNMDVTLAVPMRGNEEALVFDAAAWDWSNAKPLKVPAGDLFKYRCTVPGLGAWLVLIPAPQGALDQALNLPWQVEPETPAVDGAVTADKPTFTWGFVNPIAGAAPHCVVEVAREAMFRPVDRVELSGPADRDSAPSSSYTMHAALEPGHRYFWRVAAVADDKGRQGLWSAPRPFVYQWPEYAKAFPAQTTPPVLPPAWKPDPAATPAAQPTWQKLADEHHLLDPGSLALDAEIYATGGFMQAPSRAADGQVTGYWTNSTKEENDTFELPAQWCALWPAPVTIHSVQVLWWEGHLPKQFTIQASDDAKTWHDLLATPAPAPEPTTNYTELRLPSPIQAKYLRVYIPTAVNADKEVGIRTVVVR